MLGVLFESPHRGDSYEYTQHQKYFLNYHHLLSDSGAMIKPQWLELPISRINIHGPKDIRATEILLYI